MREKLALLCEQQLNAILAESDVAFGNIIGAATATLQISDAMQAPDDGMLPCADPAMAIAGEMRKLMMYLQFHDEFSQRLQHVIELCRLLRETPEKSEVADQALLGRVADIFSVSSEFTVLKSIFPQILLEASDQSIELF